jgi:SAM-dependent methyltransferase
MTEVADQYEALPYPERRPEDERRRLIVGSPSHPLEIDHFLFAGRRDWRRPLRALVAGGGTGDGLIQLAAVLAAAGRPYEITYLDLSRAARKVAEARAEVRGLTGIRFLTADLTAAPELGPFDYIDCCGVLHHLPEPQAGFDALARALAPDGGIGLMVYAPYGRSGIYPLQHALRRLTEGLAPKARVAAARAIVARLPKGHPFRLNPHLVDHEQGDAGFHDLLLHAQDRPFTIAELLAALRAAGLALTGLPMPWLYDLEALLPPGTPLPEGLSEAERLTLAEELNGTIKTHIVYAAPAARASLAAARPDDSAVPHLKGASGAAAARAVAEKGALRLDLGRETRLLRLDRASAPLLARIDGRTSLGAIRAALGLDPFAFGAIWQPVHRALSGGGALLYSRLLV